MDTKNRKINHILYDMTEKEAYDWLYKKHWIEEMTMKGIAELVGIHRKNLVYWFDKLGVKKRNISQDNKRRYKNMSIEQIKAQTEKANQKTRELLQGEVTKAEWLRVRKEGRKEQETSIEKAIKEILLIKKIDFEQQKQLGPWFVDFYLPKYNLVIECDGDYWHSLPDVVKRDKCKNHWLWRNGFSYIRLKEKDIKKDALKAFDNRFDRFIEGYRIKNV